MALDQNDIAKFAAILQQLVAIATQLNERIEQIKREDPEVWDAIKGDYEAASAGYRNAQPG